MAERVVDRLEAVEVDQVDGQAIVAVVELGQHVVDAFAELAAVGESGELVVARQMRDALLRALALGDVLENDDRAAVGHHAPRQRDAALAVGRGLHLVEAV